MEVPRDEASVCIVLGEEGATGVLPGLPPVALITAPRGLLKAGEDFESGHRRPPRGKPRQPCVADTCWPGPQSLSSVSNAAPW